MSIQSVSGNNSVNKSDFTIQSPVDPLCQKVIDAAHSSWFRRASTFSTVKKELSVITPEQLKIVITKVAEEKDGKEILEKLSQILPLSRIEAAIEANAMDSVKEMAKDAVDYLEKVQTRSPTLSGYIASFIDKAINVLESFLNAFGISEFFKPTENKSDAKVKAQWIMMLLQFAILLSTLAMPIFGVGVAGIVVASTMLGIWTMSLIYPYFKECP